MTGGDIIGAFFEGGFEKELKLDFLVTHDVGIRGAPFFKFIKHIFDHFFPVSLLKIPDLKINAEADGDPFGVGQIFGPGTFHAGKVF